VIVDAFAGPGGWSVALAALGFADIGIEWDAAACKTRAAAGFLTIRADVANYPTAPFRDKVRGFIGSPPCPAFSAAGKGHGTDRVPILVDLVHRRQWHARPHPDPEVWLVLDVGRWIEALTPEWVALEQVPAVLPIWRAYCHVLEQLGYSTWCGILNAADYGVPQTRRRAILTASRRRTAGAPRPTHEDDPAPSLFDQRLPWVTMADALGWSGRVGFPRLAENEDEADENGYRERDWRSTDEPSFALSSKARSWTLETGTTTERADGLHPYERSTDRPAGVLTSQARSWRVNTGRDWKEGGTREDAQTIDPFEQPSPTFGARSGTQWRLNPGATESQPNRRTYDADTEPAPTVAFGHDSASWCWERPATTVACDPRLWPPGHRINQDDIDRLGEAEARDRYRLRAGPDAFRLTIEDALALQSFPFGYPVIGSRTKQFEQIGNAIPPLLAWHILRTVTE